MEVFRKSLRKTDVGSRLSVPAKSLKKLPRFEVEGGHMHASVDFPVKDRNGSFWRFRCCIRRKSYPKPVLSGDWYRFARSKALSVGDEIILFKESNYFRVEVKKSSRLFGVSIHGPPCPL